MCPLLSPCSKVGSVPHRRMWGEERRRNHTGKFLGATKHQRYSICVESNGARASGRMKDGKRENEHQPRDVVSEPQSAYIHLPFCKKKCFYCDFPVIAVGQSKSDRKQYIDENMRLYVDTLCREMAATRRLNGKDAPLETVFFGGGTPSLISLNLLEHLLTVLEKRFGLSSDCEISIEADPGTFDASTLRSYKALGISRVSIGVQAFDDELLSVCGRAHDVTDAYRAIDAIHAADMTSWSLDLMSGLPGLTMKKWESSLNIALDTEAPHISTYDLQIEDGTPFARRYSPGVSPLPSDSLASEMYKTAQLILVSSGFEHYEVSNYAKKGHCCKHNMTYWTCRPYYGFGMGSASYLEGHRFSRPKRLNSYNKWIESIESQIEDEKDTKSHRVGRFSSAAEDRGEGMELDGMIPGSDTPAETDDDKLSDYIMLGLRLADGIDMTFIEDNFKNGDLVADRIIDALDEHIDRRTVILDYRESESDDYRQAQVPDASHKSRIWKARLMDPDGFLISNDIISDIFVALDEFKMQ